MEKSFSRILSLVLCLCMVLSVCAFNALATEQEAELATVTEYYVQAGAATTNDGRSSIAPAASLGTVIDSIIDDGHGAGDNVTVYVMRAADEIRTYTQTEIDGGKIKFIGYDTAKEHTATITYRSYDEDNKSAILFKEGYALSGTSHSTHIFIKGPSIFDGIDLIDTRADGSGFNIYCYGFDCEFRDVAFYKPNITKKDNVAVSISLDKSWYSHFQLGGYNNNTPIGNGGTIIIEDNLSDLQNLRISGSAAKGQNLTVKALHYSDDVTVKIGNGTAQNLKNIILDATGADTLYTTYEKNLNIVADNVKVTGSFGNTTSTGAVVEGAVQIILNNGSSAPATPVVFKNASKTVSADIYRITAPAGVMFDVTDIAGKYSVTGDDIAYVVTADGKTVYYSVDGYINIATPGTYVAEKAESVDAIVSALPVPEGDFEGWDDSVSGVLTASFTTSGGGDDDGEEPEPTTPKYYVKWNSNGTGLTPASPVATVADAVTLINGAGYGEGDIVEIYIMNDDSLTAAQTSGKKYTDPWWYDANGNYLENAAITKGGKLPGRQTAWAVEGGSAGTYAATLVIKGYATDSKLFQSQIVGYNCNITLGGPTVFEDITIVATRSVDREIFANGHDVTFNNVAFMYQNADNSSGSKNYSGLKNGHLRFSPSGGDTKAKDGMTITFNTPIPAETDMRYGVVIAGTKAASYTGHVKYYFNGKSENGAIGWAQGASIFEDGLSVVVNAGSYVPKVRTDVTTYTATVNGGLQVVFNNGTTPFTLPADYVDADGTWYMISADTSGNKLDVTDTAGTFTVIGGKIAWAEDADGNSYASVDGALTVPAGTYTVTYSEEEVKTGVLYLDGEEYCEYIAGTAVSLPDMPMIPGKTFVGWGYDGDLFKGSYQTAKDEIIVSLTSQYDTNPDTCIYYVDSVNGSDENNGKSAEKAFATLNAAITESDAQTETNKLVVIIGTFEITKDKVDIRTFAKHTNLVTIVGDGSGNSIIRKCDTITINGPTEFSNIRFVNTVKSKHIDTQGQKLIIGENVVFENDGGDVAKFALHTGSMNSANGARENVVINSDVGTVYVGTYYNSTSRSYPGGDYEINAEVSNMTISADGWANAANNQYYNFPSVYDGAVNIYLNEGGSIKSLSATEDRATYNENSAVHIFMNGGKVTTIAEYVAPYVWKLDTANFTDTDYLTAGSAAGTFTVVGGKTALATNIDGYKFVSSDGVLNLPQADTYTIEFVDQVYYTNSGTRIDFYADMTLDVTAVTHSEVSDKVFIGWTYEDGTVPETDEFKNGEVLVANYVQIDLDTEFFIEGAEIRTSGTPGLRFVVKKNDSVDEKLPTVEKFGSVIAPSAVLYDYPDLTEHDLELDIVYDYNGKKYNSYEVEAVNIYENMADGVRYTVVVSNMTADYYDRMYTVRGYVRFKDYNGVDRILYTDYYATRHINVAENILRDAKAGKITLSSEQIDYYQGIIDTVKAAIAEEFSGEITTMGGSPDDPNSFKHVYEIGTTGLQVRDVNIYPSDYVEGETDRKPLVIMQTSDIHFNYTSDEDFEEANPSIMSTYLGRSAFKNTVPAAERALRYSYMGDAMVITGDTLDFLSRGAMELANKHIFDVYPYALAALGNHEGTRVCQQPEGQKAPDTSTLESRHEILQENWTGHDILYSSQLVGDRVLLIQMDNGTASRFWDDQVAPLTADLELARENGYTVLIFFHIPLRTYNPNETAVEQLPNTSGRSDNSGARNFMTEGIHISANEATTQIFGLFKEYSDVIYGLFTGHTHSPYYSEFVVEMEEGTNNVTEFIPQYTMTATAYSKGNATKIIVH